MRPHGNHHSMKTTRRREPVAVAEVEEPPPKRTRKWKIRMQKATPIIVVTTAILLYCGTLQAEFAYDDSRAIKTNQDLLPETPISALFQNDFWGTPLTHSGSHKSYRPLCVLTFRLNYWLGGFDPSGYHLFNVILHAVVCGLFAKLSAIVFRNKVVPALVSGLIFAAHPIHTEAVAGVVGRADVGACMFFLLSFLSYMKYCEDRTNEVGSSRFIYLYGSLILSALSMLFKEQGIMVLAVCFVYDLFMHHRVAFKEIRHIALKEQHQNLREGLFHLIITGVALLGFRVHLMGSKTPDFAQADNPAADSDSLLTRTLTFLFLPAFNFWLLLFPGWLSFDWSMEAIPLLETLKDYRNMFTLSFYSGLVFGIKWLIKCYNSRCIHNNVINPLPTNLPSSSSGIFRSRENDCPCLISAYKAAHNNNNHNHHNNHHHNNHHHSRHNRRGHGNHGRFANVQNHYVRVDEFIDDDKGLTMDKIFSGAPDIVLFSLALIILPFIPATNLFFYVGFVVAERVLYIPSMGFSFLVGLGFDILYRNQNTLKKKRVVLTSLGIMMLLFTARTLRRNWDWYDEENLYRSGIPVNPPKAYGNLANILSGRGAKVQAEWAYRQALGFRYNMADVRYNLGILLQEQERYEEALNSYQEAIQFRPRLAMAHLNMGLVLGNMGRKAEAARAYRHCADLDGSGLKDPKIHETTRISALFNLGRLHADSGNYEQAVKIYQEAVSKMPPHYQPQSLFNMIGEAYTKMGHFLDAEYWYSEALRVKPDHIPAFLTYAKLLTKWGRLPEAEKWFLKAQRIAPNDSSVYQHYGQFLSETDRHQEAADVFVKAAKFASEEFEIVFNAANALRQAGRNEEAETYYLVAVKLKPNEVTSHMNLGAMLHVNGKLEEAEAAYLNALRLRPEDHITQNNLDRLRTIIHHRKVRDSLLSKNPTK